ncbi:MAG: DUF5668 domain-containing protein [candidate division Zixibacteria bacterium]|nr:DUF5668 domain-containing protein [candidate division Zixibacteria bacterium]
MNIAKIRNGVILTSVGLVLLLNNLDYVDWAVWLSILSLWPVLLIAIGIEKLFARTVLSFLALLSPVLLLLAILGPAYFYLDYQGKPDSPAKTFNLEKGMDFPYKKGYASLDFKTGKLLMSSSQDKLITADLDYWTREPLFIHNYSEQDSTVRLNVNDVDRSWKGWFKDGFNKNRHWNIYLSDKIPWELEIENDVMSGDLDFSELILEKLTLDLDVSNLKVKLGNRAKYLNATIEADISKLVLLLPRTARVKLEKDATLSSTEFKNITLDRSREKYWTYDSDSADSRIEIQLRGDISKLEIVGY